MPAADINRTGKKIRMPSRFLVALIAFIAGCLLMGSLALAELPPGVADAQRDLRKQERELKEEQDSVREAEGDLRDANREYRDAKTDWEIAKSSEKSFESDYKGFKKLLDDLSSGFDGAFRLGIEALGFDQLGHNRAMVRGALVNWRKARAKTRRAFDRYQRASRDRSKAESDLRRAKNRVSFHQNLIAYYQGLIRKLSKKPEEKTSRYDLDEETGRQLNNWFGEWNNLIRQNQNSLRDKTRESNQEDEVIRKEQNPDSRPTQNNNNQNINNNAHPCPPYCS